MNEWKCTQRKGPAPSSSGSPTSYGPNDQPGDQTLSLLQNFTRWIFNVSASLHFSSFQNTLLSLLLDGNAFETSRGCQLHRVSRERRPQSAQTLKTLKLSSEHSRRWFCLFGSLQTFRTHSEVVIVRPTRDDPFSFPSLFHRRTPGLVLLDHDETRPLQHLANFRWILWRHSRSHIHSCPSALWDTVCSLQGPIQFWCLVLGKGYDSSTPMLRYVRFTVRSRGIEKAKPLSNICNCEVNETNRWKTEMP